MAVLERVVELLRAQPAPARFDSVTVTVAPLDADEHLHRLYEADMGKVGMVGRGLVVGLVGAIFIYFLKIIIN